MPKYQRELKFRAWDTETGDFVYFNILSKKSLEKFTQFSIKSPKIQQFTGLTDRFGNDIYEGDVVKTIKDSETGVLWSTFFPNVPFPQYTNGLVEFVNSSFCVCQNGLGRTELDKLSTGSISYALEVISVNTKNVQTEDHEPCHRCNHAPTAKPETKPEQIWLVDYECRTDAVRISLDNRGFYAFGQEPCWAFSAVSNWHHCIFDPNPKPNPNANFNSTTKNRTTSKHDFLKVVS